MFLELNLDDGLVIFNVDHINSIDIVKHYDIYQQNKLTHHILRIRTTDGYVFYKHFAMHDDMLKQYAFEYFEMLSKMLNTKKEASTREDVK